MGTGLSTYYFQDGQAASHLDELHALWTSFAGSMPSAVTIRIPGSGETLNAATGAIDGVWTGTAPALITGAASGTYAAGVGMRVRWFTGVLAGDRYLTGATFVVPLATGAYQSDGSILDTVVSANQTAVNTFVTGVAPDYLIWHRPVGGSGGGADSVVSGQVVDRTSWLTSRRT